MRKTQDQVAEEVTKLIKELRTDQIEKILLARQYHCEKFVQLQPGMLFNLIAGFDDSTNEIINVDVDMMCFLYKDISITNSKLKCSPMFFIPNPVYFNRAAMEKNVPFKFKTPEPKTVLLTFIDKL